MIEISVTQDDIDNGKKVHVHSCPVALAAQRTLHDPRISVGVHDMGSLFSRYLLPEVASEFILAFDMGDPVQPFTFYVTKTPFE